MYVSPYKDLSVAQVYDGLMSGKFGPRWPEEKLQIGYTGTKGPGLLKRAFDFIDILEKDGVFKPGWKGLDYGCGWGRFASAMLSRGSADQFDACDAWQNTLVYIAGLNYANRIFKVSELLERGEIPESTYDFIMSFSVFTHLSPKAFQQNIPVLVSGLKDGGALYITVRHDEFIDHKYPERGDEMRKILKDDGIVFVDSGGDLTGEKVFGDTVVTEQYMRQFGVVRYLGQPHQLHHIYAISR